jgi:rhamnogalacturonyl hydrolase YesR
MAGTLVYLPADDPRRLEIEGAFKKLVDTMCRYRHEDGLWPWSMRQYRAPQDTSGSAMIAFAIERGVEVGVLDPRLLETSTDVLEAIIKHTTDTGLIDQAQDDAAGVGLYGYEFGPSAWGQASGFALHPMSSALRTQ